MIRTALSGVLRLSLPLSTTTHESIARTCSLWREITLHAAPEVWTRLHVELGPTLTEGFVQRLRWVLGHSRGLPLKFMSHGSFRIDGRFTQRIASCAEALQPLVQQVFVQSETVHIRREFFEQLRLLDDYREQPFSLDRPSFKSLELESYVLLIPYTLPTSCCSSW